MRLDRFLTRLVFHPLVRAGLGPRGFRLPILMYHSISDDPENGVSPYYRTSTRPEQFAEHMAMLRTQGYQAVTLSQGLERLYAGSTPACDCRGRLPRHPSPVATDRAVVLTFDDGFQDFYRTAFPILQQHGFGATVYLPTAFIGETPRQFKHRACLTWSEVDALHRAGIEFGSHTVNHPPLVDLEWGEIERELRDSKTAIEQRLGAPVKAFAYPYAFPQADRIFVRHLQALLETVRYESCVTTKVGCASPASEPLQLERLPVNTGDDTALLRAKLEGGYDWLAALQKLAKKYKSRRGSSRFTLPIIVS
jgi:peptidoglycan/xylan/chitin deacetylase (PgdA/CDA1 family)